MADDKFTPGPWEASRDCPSGQLHVRTIDPNGAWICGQVANRDDIQPDEYEANAKLLAAAPMLLAACRELVDVSPIDSEWGYCSCCSARHGHTPHCPVEMARAAIAKALGLTAPGTEDEDNTPRCIVTGQHRNDGRGMCIDCDYAMVSA